MQFYIIHSDPTLSSARLPLSMLRVNVREGWQILSDIGHFYDLKWEGQTKPYNINHPTTMRFRESQEEFAVFIQHYRHCLAAYVVYYGGDSVWAINLRNVPKEEILDKIGPAQDRYATIREYILTAKSRQMKDGERAEFEVFHSAQLKDRT